jgi:hypothetical protein
VDRVAPLRVVNRGARALAISGAARRTAADVGGAAFLALVFFAATALVGIIDPLWGAMMIPLLGGGAVAVLGGSLGCFRPGRGGLSRT